jgi:site-specific recombinase XerD
VTVAVLDLGAAARILRDALKDKSYRSTPLGLEVARYVRWFRSEWGATPESVRDYESILARLALFCADLELEDMAPPVGTERLRECWDHYWSDAKPRTRAKVRSVWVAFFDFCIREGRLHGNPARALAAPRKRGVKREPFAQNMVDKVVSSQRYLGDRLGCSLILFYALRRAEIAAVKFRDFDFERRTLIVQGKGGKVRVLPIIDEHFWRDLGALELELGGHDFVRELFLICPRRAVGMRTYYQHHHGFVPRSVHRWWYSRLEEAGMDATTGLGMHRGRHTAATNVLRATGNLAAAQALLGHADISTTIESYADYTTKDLADALTVTRQAEEG